ncbi:MAG: hypothetical protein E6Q97_34215 [Desulfurellales bacterium]|nr:MAG: hypothetical protein E6Q97_34215 [Desulfurellales bacterium]
MQKATLCRAWMRHIYDEQGNPTGEEEVFIQTPFAPHKNFTCGVRKFSNTLEKDDTVWYPIDLSAIPDSAEYIGQYNIKRLPIPSAA